MNRFAIVLGLAAMLPLAAAAECASVSAGALTVSGAWSRATIGAARPAVFYAEIRNDGETSDRLTGIETPVAGMPMLHRTVIEDGVASMPHAEAIDIPAGETVNLAPGVYVFRPSGALSSIIDFHEDRQFAVPKIRRAIE